MSVDTVVRFVHLAAAAYWLGGLVMLALVVGVGVRVFERGQLQALLVPLARAFAWGAAVAGVILLISGYLLASRRLLNLDALSSTAYGRRLALKLVLVALTLATTFLHVLLGRSMSSRLLLVSRGMAGLALLFTIAVFFAAARLVSG